MAVMEEALSEYILSHSAVTDLTGSGDNARLYPFALHQDCNLANGPAATYEIVLSQDIQTLANRAGIVQSRVRISTFALTHFLATKLLRAIKNSGIAALKGIYAGVDFRGVVIEDGIRCYGEQPTDGGETWRYIAEMDLMISYLEG
jgi:hypothetical protein